MSLVLVDGNLLTSDCNIIAHQCNCQNTMGKGIALSIKEMFPEAYIADSAFHPRSPETKLGKVSYGISVPHKKIIANLYGQLNYWRYGEPKVCYTNYDALRSAIEILFNTLIVPIQNPKVGVPFNMGCALAGGDWKIVSDILNEVSTKYGHTIYTYRLS